MLNSVEHEKKTNYLRAWFSHDKLKTFVYVCVLLYPQHLVFHLEAPNTFSAYVFVMLPRFTVTVLTLTRPGSRILVSMTAPRSHVSTTWVDYSMKTSDIRLDTVKVLNFRTPKIQIKMCFQSEIFQKVQMEWQTV